MISSMAFIIHIVSVTLLEDREAENIGMRNNRAVKNASDIGCTSFGRGVLWLVWVSFNFCTTYTLRDDRCIKLKLEGKQQKHIAG